MNVNNALTNSQALGIAQQHAKRRMHKVTYPQPSPRNSVSSGGQSAGQKRARSGSGGAARKRDNVNLVSFVLRKHPKEEHVGTLDREYIRTSSELKVRRRMKLRAKRAI